MFRIGSALCVSLFFALASPTLAQVVFDEDGKPMPPGQPLKLREGAPIPVWVSVGNFRPFRSLPANNDDARMSFLLPFMQLAYVVREATDNDRDDFMLIASRDGNTSRSLSYMGWVPKQHLLTSTYADRDKRSKLAKKCILVNRYEVSDSLNAINYNIVSAFDTPYPTEKNKPIEKFPLRTLLYIFDERNHYVLVGLGEAFAPRHPLDSIKGWVSKERVERWDHRIAVEWDAITGDRQYRPNSGVIFADAITAGMHLDSKVKLEEIKNDESKVVFLENRDARGRTIHFTSDYMRFPVLEDYNMAQSTTHRENNYLYRVGWSAPLQLDAKRLQDLQDERDRLRDLIGRYQRVQILFVIDKTTGMEPYAESVQAIVDRLVERYRDPLRGIYKRDVKVAVSMYSDASPNYRDRIKQPVSHSGVISIRDAAGVVRLNEFILKHRGAPGGDVPESFFNGVAEAVNHTDFGEPGRKIVILIGDAGDHEDWRGSASYRCLAALKPVKTAQGFFEDYEFFAVPVTSLTERALTDEQKKHAKRFVDQCTSLCEAVNEAWQEAHEGLELSNTALVLEKPETPEEVVERIWERYEAVEAEYETTISRLNSLIAQTTSETAKSFEKDVVARMERSGFYIDRLGKFDLVNIYRHGFVWKYAKGGFAGKTRQVREMALLVAGDVRRINNVLGQIVAARKQRGGQKQLTVNDILDPLIDGLSAENRDAGLSEVSSLKEWFRQRKIPVSESALMNYSKGNKSFRIDDRLLADLELKYRRLQLVLQQLDDDYQPDFQTWQQYDRTGTNVELETTDLKKDDRLYEWKCEQKSRWFSMPGDPYLMQHVWLDVSSELP